MRNKYTYATELFISDYDSTGEVIDAHPVAHSRWFSSRQAAYDWLDNYQGAWEVANVYRYIDCGDGIPEGNVLETVENPK